jgi:DDE superfamily endonuclease
LIGFRRTLKRIITIKALKAGRITKSKQDGNQEFILILATISAIGR